jgi:hypothetical protein
MIGRKRSREAWRIACRDRLPFLALRLEREVDHHDRVLLDDADQQHDADDADHAQIIAVINSASSAPTPADGKVDRIVTGWMKLS